MCCPIPCRSTCWSMRLCASVGADPYRCGDEAIILSVSAGCGALRDSLSSAETHEQGRDAARAQLAASSCKPDSFVQWGAAWRTCIARTWRPASSSWSRSTRARPSSAGSRSARSPISPPSSIMRAISAASASVASGSTAKRHTRRWSVWSSPIWSTSISSRVSSTSSMPIRRRGSAYRSRPRACRSTCTARALAGRSCACGCRTTGRWPSGW